MRVKYNVQDMNLRLHGGLAFYDGRVVYVAVDGAVLILYSFPDLKPVRTVSPTDQSLDISSPTLGYVNMDRYAVYVFRRPVRVYKQTLTMNACGFWQPIKTKSLDIEKVFNSSNFVAMLEDHYPYKVDDVLNDLEKSKVTSRALSRDVCLSRDSFGITRVYFKQSEVGYIKPGEKIVRVPESTRSWMISRYLSDYEWKIE